MTESWYYYHKRKELGLCTHCGKYPPVPDHVECEKCLKKKQQRMKIHYEAKHTEIREKARERIRQRKAESRANGMCLRCFIQPADKGYKSCWRCRMNNRRVKTYVMSGAQKQRAAELKKARDQRRIEEHICVRCGKRPARERFKDCEICAAKYNRRRREKAHERGVIPRELGGTGLYCRHCFKPKCHGERICPDCLDKLREQGRQLNDWNKAHGWKCSRRFREMNNYHFISRSSLTESKARIDYNAVRFGMKG